MKTYLLFVFGTFEDHEDIEFFCAEVLGQSKSVETIRYVIEGDKNIIVIFESSMGQKELSEDLYGALINENIKFYFVFERDTLTSAHLPVQMKEFIFKPYSEFEIMKVDFVKNEIDPPLMDLDELLDKIEKMGVDSLTPEEKKFLDNFEN